MKGNKKTGVVFEYIKQREDAISRRRNENIFISTMQSPQLELDVYRTGLVQQASSIAEQ